MSSSPTPQTLRKCGEVAPGERGQVFDHRLHRRVEAVALDKLQFETLRKTAGEDAGRLEALEARQHRFHPFERRAKALGKVLERRPEVAGLVERVDQRRRNHSLDRIGHRDHRLPVEEFGERFRRRDIGLEIRDRFAAAAADAGP